MVSFFSLPLPVASFPCAAGELGNAVQDAFVIAVEQQARERLQRLSALKRITPVDMSQLSIKVRANKTSNEWDTTTTKSSGEERKSESMIQFYLYVRRVSTCCC